MKFRTSRKLKNMILSINFAILHFRVRKYENHFFFFFYWKAIKIAGSAQKSSVGQVSGNTGIFFFRPKVSKILLERE